MENKLIISQIQTPDGTILRSMHIHDYVTHVDKNGLEYMLDGGTEYQRYNVHENAPFKDISLYLNSPFEEIRKYYCRGGRGKNGTQPLKWVPLCKMSDEWLKNSIKYNIDRKMGDSNANYLYNKELEYRTKFNISIQDND